MIVDTSALAAIAFGDAERETFEDLILQTPGAATSAAVVLELELILRMRFSTLDSGAVDRLVELLGLEVVAFDGSQAKLARAAFAAYGHGRHEAGLTFNNCVVMGLARARDLPILFKGGGFALTDARSAWPLTDGNDA